VAPAIDGHGKVILPASYELFDRSRIEAFDPPAMMGNATTLYVGMPNGEMVSVMSLRAQAIAKI
jgi:hypothetical protein